ncbi:MAG TPA: hypothetical protein VMW16_04225 [Sedimentisphaerales bacterium]|nr:hypothetical protein [Sedimentisphaerales bacterium]
MKRADRKTTILMVLAGALVLAVCSGCGGLLLSPIYNAALLGGAVGGIIGYQSGETAAGALLGAGILGAGELVKQTDQLAKGEQPKDCGCKGQEKVVVEITNSNGSITPVELRKKGCVYTGPKGEQYQQLPTEEQLRPVYGF